jgi:hypothetical protein
LVMSEKDTLRGKSSSPCEANPQAARMSAASTNQGPANSGHEHPVKDGAFVRAPITSCWNYDFLEADCDGPDHYKAFVADGSRPDSMIGAYIGDRGDPRTSPPRAKACGVSGERTYCVSDYSDDGKTVWLDTGRNLESHTLAIGCPGPRLEYPCTSKDP